MVGGAGIILPNGMLLHEFKTGMVGGAGIILPNGMLLHEFKTGRTITMELVIMFLTWRWEADRGVCMAEQYFWDQESVNPRGWVCVATAQQPSRMFMLMPIAAMEGDMWACVHVGWVGMAHGQMTGTPQAWVRVEQTWAISDLRDWFHDAREDVISKLR